MRAITATEARKHIFQLIKDGEKVEIRHPQRSMILVSKDEFDQLEKEIFMREMDDALERAKGQKRYTTEQVEAMLVEVLGEDVHG